METELFVEKTNEEWDKVYSKHLFIQALSAKIPIDLLKILFLDGAYAAKDILEADDKERREAARVALKHAAHWDKHFNTIS